MRHSTLSHYKSKYVWNKNFGQDTLFGLNVAVKQACHWFDASKPFANTRDNRTYTQVTKISTTNVTNNQGGRLPSPRTHASCIVTVTSRNANANAKTITSSKVGIKNRAAPPRLTNLYLHNILL